MTHTLLLATNNAHKVREIREILKGLDIHLEILADHPDLPEPPETGDTFEANAIQKAKFIHDLTGRVVIADDSGIEVDALGGRPGVHSKRYSEEATAEANNKKLLAELATTHDRRARFRCVLALVSGTGTHTADGSCEGRIADTLSGVGGFGYDPLFIPEDLDGRTMAEASDEEKNAISHRGRAFRQLPDLLQKAGLAAAAR